MNQVCLLCARESAEHNLFCYAGYCPAEASPVTFGLGDRLGDIEVVRLVGVTRGAALYEAQRSGAPVMLKVAHPGDAAAQRLKRETSALLHLGAHQGGRMPAGLPVLLPAIPAARVSDSPYGRAVVRDQLRYYCITQPIPGEPLRALLRRRPQLWIYHVGWIVQSLGSAIAQLHAKGLLHAAIAPDSLLVALDDAGGVPQVTLSDLGYAASAADLAGVWHDGAFAHPAYRAPEILIGPVRPSLAGDVYGIGMILYELLIGTPPYDYRGRGDRAVIAAVAQGAILPMARTDDVGPVARIAEQAVRRNPAERQVDAPTLVRQLINDGGIARPRIVEPPAWQNPRVLVGSAIIMLTGAFIILAGMSFAEIIDLLVVR